ncbi:MAG: HAD hydrolase family protein, partial [Chloroflexota bacterium]
MGVSMSEVAAIGDGRNDVPLLSSAGLAIAMGNANDDLKKIAHHVTDDVEHSGLAKAVKKFLL